MSRTVTVTLVAGKTYQQQITARTHAVVSDVDVASGGADGGPDPKELALGALGACTAMTILMVAPKKKWDVQSISVTVTLSEETDPADSAKKIAVITDDITVSGSITASELAAIKATAAKCPVYKLLTEAKKMVTNVTHQP